MSQSDFVFSFRPFLMGGGGGGEGEERKQAFQKPSIYCTGNYGNASVLHRITEPVGYWANFDILNEFNKIKFI